MPKHNHAIQASTTGCTNVLHMQQVGWLLRAKGEMQRLMMKTAYLDCKLTTGNDSGLSVVRQPVFQYTSQRTTATSQK